MRAQWLVAGLAFLLPLLFALFTNHAWEDYYITLRSSRNLVEGHGLVFNPGERVHTFTSPLGVLVPALCTWIAGAGNEQAGLWLFRIVNALALGAAAALTWRRLESLGVSLLARVLGLGLLLAESKLLDFSINGMETALLVFFVLLLWAELESPAGPRASGIAIGVGGLMWTRPDAFILGAALLLPHALFRRRHDGAVRTPWSALMRGILIGGLIYVPWFAWAWWYYGAPVPHTVIAKSAFTAPVTFMDLLRLPAYALVGQSSLADLYIPSYAAMYGGWSPVVTVFSKIAGTAAAFLWLVPRASPTVRRISLAVFLGMFYISSIILFPWYVPPWSALASLAIALAVDAAYRAATARQAKLLPSVIRITAAGTVALQAIVLVAAAWQLRAQQEHIEFGIRKPIGEWLRQNARRTDTVFLEPLGYVGYYSQLRTYDFPGLSSPEVVAAIRGGARSYAAVIRALKPDWVLLRVHEATRSEFRNSTTLADYELVRAWDVMPQLDAIRFLPGRQWLESDARFLLFRRRARVEPQ